MDKRRLLPLLFSALVFSLACDRVPEPIGAAPRAPDGSPKYTVELSSVSAVSRESHIVEVAPKIGGGLDGAKLYATNCSACHQINGQGVPGAFPPLDGSEYVLSDKVDRMASIMIYGLVGPITVKGQNYASAMAPLGATLKDDELAAIATYVRSAWSNKAGAVEATTFTEMRSKWGTRAPFTIEELGAE